MKKGALLKQLFTKKLDWILCQDSGASRRGGLQPWGSPAVGLSRRGCLSPWGSPDVARGWMATGDCKNVCARCAARAHSRNIGRVASIAAALPSARGAQDLRGVRVDREVLPPRCCGFYPSGPPFFQRPMGRPLGALGMSLWHSIMELQAALCTERHLARGKSFLSAMREHSQRAKWCSWQRAPEAPCGIAPRRVERGRAAWVDPMPGAKEATKIYLNLPRGDAAPDLFLLPARAGTDRVCVSGCVWIPHTSPSRTLSCCLLGSQVLEACLGWKARRETHSQGAPKLAIPVSRDGSKSVYTRER